ncbi:Plant self-incompatibility S1 protein [Raphanus sativus]|nr:Plant self-incompatibility S1 protein [Raphanus sativus]
MSHAQDDFSLTGFDNPRTTVVIINDLADPPLPLRYHCKSRDDDLGDRTMAPRGSWIPAQQFASSCCDTCETHRFIKVRFLLFRAWRWALSAARQPQDSTETLISRYALLRVLRFPRSAERRFRFCNGDLCFIRLRSSTDLFGFNQKRCSLITFSVLKSSTEKRKMVKGQRKAAT